ncbi:hypothetical protein Tco_0883358 [Tanacetum coccineum]
MSYKGLSCYLCGDPLDGILCRRCSCGWCGNKLDDGFCSYCASKAEDSFAYDSNPNSFDNSLNFSYPPPQPQFETYLFSLSPSPIPVEDSDPFMEEIDMFLASDDSTPPGVKSDYDSEVDILLLEGLLNNDLVPLAEYHHFTFDVEPDPSVKNDFDELNEDECFDPGGGENVVFLNVEEDDSFTFTIRTFLPFVTYPEVSPLLSSTKNEDTIFDPGIST